MKSTPLTDIETVYIDAKRNTMSIDELAKKLKRGVTIIKKYIDSHPVEVAATQPENTAPTRVGNMAVPDNRGAVYDRRYGSKKIGAVMTEGLSQQHDEFGKQNKKSIFDKKGIHKIK